MGYEVVECEDGTSIHKNEATNTGNYVIACALFASLNSVLLGYDIGVMSGAIIFIEQYLKITEVQEEILVGCFSIVSLIGSLTGGTLSDAIGRKGTMATSAIIFQIGGLTMAIAPTFSILMAGRLLSGIGVGLGSSVIGVYITELSPAMSRGFLTTLPEIFINIGILLGYVSNYAFSGLPININWRIMIALAIIPSVILVTALFLLPESPRWLVLRNRVDEAKLVLLKTLGDETEVAERLAEIQLSAEKTNSKFKNKAVWHELLRPNATVCKMLLAGIGIQCFQQITGSDALVYYSPTIFKAAGIVNNSQLLAATVAMGITKTSFVFVALFLFDKVGRKPLLYASTIGMTICLLGVAISLPFLEQGKDAVMMALIFVCGNVAFFSVGMGPICWILTSEIFPLRLRAQAAALGNAVNRLSGGLISLSFLSLCSSMTVSGTFFLFSVFSAFSVVFVHKIVPETKGKTLEQIECLFKEQDPRQCETTEPLMS